MKCETCKYWSAYSDNKSKGTCRKDTPKVTVDIGGAFGFYGTSVETHWPETAYTEWCGQYEKEPNQS